jgi:hypothetical protein
VAKRYCAELIIASNVPPANPAKLGVIGSLASKSLGDPEQVLASEHFGH